MSEAAVWVDLHRQGGEPCIMGTRLPTSIVAGLAWDGGIKTVHFCYSYLTDEQILGACWYEVAHGNRRSWRRKFADWPRTWNEQDWVERKNAPPDHLERRSERGAKRGGDYGRGPSASVTWLSCLKQGDAMTGQRIFLDVGAHTGETLRVVRDPRWRFDRIVCFEPAPSCWPLLDALADDRVEVCRFGLWSEDAALELHNAGHVGASMAADKDRVTSTTLCAFRDAGAWFADHVSADDEVFVKVNVEGAEVDLLTGLSASGQLGKVDHLLIHFDVRKVPGQEHREAEGRALLDTAVVEYLSADEIQFGGVVRGTRNWLAWCDAGRFRGLRYRRVARVEAAVRRRLYPLKRRFA